MQRETIHQVYSTKGRREYMEDYTLSTKITEKQYPLFGVFDGHGGHEVARFCHYHLPTILEKEIDSHANIRDAIIQSFEKLDDMVCSMHTFKDMGSTCVICLIVDDKCWFANIGDSMAMTIDTDAKANYRFVSEKHSAANEADMIREKEGLVFHYGGDLRLFGVLNLSRGFGDVELKKYMSAVPYVCEVDTASVKNIVIASDGVWDYLNIDQVAKLAMNTNAPMVITQAALKAGSRDNIAAMHICFST